MRKILLFLSLSFMLLGCQNEYIQFHEEQKEQQIITNQIENFNFESLQNISGVELYHTPDLEWLESMVQKIDDAKTHVYVEVYIFTEKRLKKALINAKKRGVDVKVILEKNVYMASNLNKDVFNEFQKAGISVVYSNAENYSLNHTKMMLVDDEVIVSTGNYSYSTFKYNREFFIVMKNKNMYPYFLDIFQSDFEGTKKNIYHPNIVLSPYSSRTQIEYLLRNATKSIKMYVHNFSDKNLLDILIQKKKENIDIQIVMPDLKKVTGNENELEILKQNNINVVLVDKPEIHAKSILIDEMYLYIGSINFSAPSIDKNREIGILLKEQNIIKQFLTIFNDDFQK